jgi:hypothetical protein
MNALDAIKQIRIMLGVDQVVETAAIQMAKATLVDGTEVEVEGSFEVGKQLSVLTAEGPIPAPEGVHETTEGLVVTVDAQGVITNIEEKEVEEVAAESTETALSEDFVKQIVDIIDNRFSELNNKLQNLNQEFSAFKNEPAGKKITNNLNETNSIQGDIASARFEKIVEFRNQTKK